MGDSVKVQGIVVDRDGRTVADATIVVVEGTSPMPEIALVSDACGRFALRLPRGRFLLEAQGEDARKGQTTIEVTSPLVETRIEVD